MDKRFWQHGLGLLPSIFAGLGLILIVVNGVLALANRSSQIEVNTRAQYIAQTVQLERVLQVLVRATINVVITNKDTELSDLLTANGISYDPGTTGSAAAQPSAPAANPAGAARGQPARTGR